MHNYQIANKNKKADLVKIHEGLLEVITGNKNNC